MSAIRQADTRGPASIRESDSRAVDELAWPPSSDDLDAIDVVPMAAFATGSKTDGPVSPQPLARQYASRQIPSLPSLTDLLAVHDLSADADTFRSEATQSATAAEGLLQSGGRQRSWTRLALCAAASVVVLTTMYPFVWRPPSPELPQIAESAPAAPAAAPLLAAAQPAAAPPAAAPPAAATAAMPETAVVTPPDAAPRASAPVVPTTPPASTPREPVPFVSRPESQRVLQPHAQPARPVETMARSTVPVVVPPGALLTPGMAAMPTAASRDEVDAAPAARIAPIRTVSVPERIDDVGVQAALQRYESAYSRLDARAAQAVWPSVDARALERAFDSLESQSLQFDRCELDVRETVARADCLGTATYVRRIGSKAPRTETRAWTFNLRKMGDAWQILSAAAR